jgi:heat shock protein HslJ
MRTSTLHHRWSVAAAVIVAVVALAVAGCGSDDSSEATDASSSQAGDAVTADDLAGSTYASTSVTGHDLVEGSTITLSFEGPRMSASAGCNIMSAAYEVADDGTLAWTGEPAATMMACEDDLTAQDQWLIGLFQDGVTATSDGSTLTLTNDEVTIELAAAE